MVPNKSLEFLVNLLKAAGQFKLGDLIQRCEQQLIPLVTVSNCVELFVRAEENGAEALRKFCSTLMSTHWVNYYQTFSLIITYSVLCRMI